MKVIVIQCDGLQLAALSMYGNVWVDTPNLDRLAAISVVFDQHFADVPSEQGIVQAMYGGRHCLPPMEGEREVSRSRSVFELLLTQKVHCYVSLHAGPSSTVLGTDSPPSSTEYSVLSTEELQNHLQRLSEVEDILVWLKTHIFPPWDICDDLFAQQCEDWEFEGEPVPWPDPAPGWLDPSDELSFARLQRSYAAVVEALDEKIGQWIDLLSQQLWWPETALIFTAGRGLNLGEHGLICDFRPWLHEELVHLPLIIRLPLEAQAGRRICAITQTVDIPATILDMFGIDKPHDWHGASLLPLCHGGPPIRNYACMGLQIADATEYALRTSEAGIILPHKVPTQDPPRQPMLFVKPDDRFEVNDLRQPNLEEAESLEQLLRARIAACEFTGKAASVVS